MTYVYTTLAHFIFRKNEGGKGRKQISTKTCYEIKKISTFLLKGEEGWGVAIFTKKNKLKSEMFNNRKN